jgi:2-methylcitrate dehydratase PrpD
MVVAARLLRLNREQMLHAFGIAGSHSAGTMEYDQTGGEIKRVHAGIAARSGGENNAASLTKPKALALGRLRLPLV